MNDFKDKIYARELLAKAVELLSNPQKTFFVLDILSEFGDKALLAKTCEKLLNEPNLGYMKITGYLKNINPNLAKKRAIKTVENAKIGMEILHTATDVLDIFKDKWWAIEIVKSGIIASR